MAQSMMVGTQIQLQENLRSNNNLSPAREPTYLLDKKQTVSLSNYFLSRSKKKQSDFYIKRSKKQINNLTEFTFD
jgi:hypothetical protein